MEYEFSYSERIEGAIVAEYEGTAIIEGSRDDWHITKILLDASIENPKRNNEYAGFAPQPLFLRVDVELPTHHQLYMKIMIELLQGPQRDEINQRWAARPAVRQRMPA